MKKQHYTVEDFLNHNNRSFLHYTYKHLLLREIEPQALAHYLSLLYAKKKTKLEILLSIRYSQEGRLKNVTLLGAKKRYLFIQLYKIFPLLRAFPFRKIKYQFEGPFDSSYSLAQLNRNAALAYEKKFQNKVSLFSTEGPGDFSPSENFLSKNPLVKRLYLKSKKNLQCQVVFRNLYPPRVHDMMGELNILNLYAWEESGFPLEYVDAFNQNLDAIIAVSNYTKKVLRTNGVSLPIKVIPNSIDQILEIHATPVPLKTKKTFKFLHISSCFPRKGVDILLKAYTNSFTKSDDVTLIIKTFPNPHNDVEDQIKNIKATNKNMPEIELINEDLSDTHIKWLYENSDALVAPSRGEGFGLPMAEAMMMHLPVITTAYGGQTDFCKENNSWLIDYQYAPAQTHFNLSDSYWVEPSASHLEELLKTVASVSKTKLKEKTTKAYSLASNELLWNTYVQKTERFIKELKNKKNFDTKPKEIAWVSSYNTKCGIASYSEFIINNLDTTEYKVTLLASNSKEILDAKKEQNIIRCWSNRFDNNNDALISNILKPNFESLLINFNFGFFSMQNLATIIDKAYDAKKKITIIFHSVKDVKLQGQESSLSWILSSLQKANYLLVHTIDDMNSLKKLGLKNIELLSHGVQNRAQTEITQEKNGFTIASYGFMLPHKGILELIEAFSLVEKNHSNVRLNLVNAIYPAPISQDYFLKCKKRIQELKLSAKITIETNFLSDEETFKLLEKANLIVLPYHLTQESSSASVRHALATRKPVLCTSQPIFNDVQEIVHFMKNSNSTTIAQTIEELLNDNKLLNSHTKKQKKWIEEHDWQKVSQGFKHFL